MLLNYLILLHKDNLLLCHDSLQVDLDYFKSNMIAELEKLSIAEDKKIMITSARTIAG